LTVQVQLLTNALVTNWQSESLSTGFGLPTVNSIEDYCSAPSFYSGIFAQCFNHTGEVGPVVAHQIMQLLASQFPPMGDLGVSAVAYFGERSGVKDGKFVANCQVALAAFLL
jgi:hypothetical protein